MECRWRRRRRYGGVSLAETEEIQRSVAGGDGGDFATVSNCLAFFPPLFLNATTDIAIAAK